MFGFSKQHTKRMKWKNVYSGLFQEAFEELGVIEE